MDNNETQVEETAEVVENTSTENKQEVRFTQEQVNEIVAKEKARAKKNAPSKEEMDEFNAWKESKKTESEKQVEREKKYSSIENDNSRLKKENFLLKNKVEDENDIDYIIYTVSKMEGEFEDNVKEFLTKNPRYQNKEEEKQPKKATGTQANNSSSETESGVSAILKLKHPELFK